MADFFSGMAQGLSSTMGMRDRRAAQQLERDKFNYQKQQDVIQNDRASQLLDLQKQAGAREQETFDLNKKAAARHAAAMQMFNAGVARGGLSGGIDALDKNGFADEALAIKQKKAEIDKTILEQGQLKQATDDQKQKTLTSVYQFGGRGAADVLAKNGQPDQEPSYQAYRKLMEPIMPGVLPAAFNAEAKQLLGGLVSAGLPQEQRYQQQKQLQELNSQKAGIQQRVMDLKSSGRADAADALQKELDQNNIQAADARMKILDADLKNASDKASTLMKQYTQDTQTFKNAQIFKNRVDQLVEAQKDPAKYSPYNDLGLIYSIMKMADPSPNNSVREGEQATAANTGSVSEKIRAQYERVRAGGTLSAQQREELQRTAGIFYGSIEKQYDNIRGAYTKMGEQYGLTPDQYMPDYKQSIQKVQAEKIFKDPTIPDELKSSAKEALDKGADPKKVMDRIHQLMQQQRQQQDKQGGQQ